MLQLQNGPEAVEGLAWNGCEKLDVLEALLAHVRINKRLLEYIEGSTGEQLDPETMRRDFDGALGQWLHGVGGMVSDENPLFKELMSLHAEFHDQAAEIVSAVNRGERECARNLLQQGRYARTSRRINALLAKISLEFEF